MDNVRDSHRAQRTNNFMLYLKSLQMRLPYFPASGHNNYAMSAYIFLQDMLALKYLNPRAYNLFNDGYFFVRRSDRYWAGLPSDLVIEQVLMASLKNTKSGITHGRGLEERQRSIWLHSRPAFAHLKYEINQLYKKDNKHINIELTNNRIKEDTEAISKILNYIKEHNPFNYNNPHLVDISTGIAYPNANAHRALEIGTNILEKMDGVEVKLYTFKKVDRIKPMGEKIMVGEEEVFIDHNLLFQRSLVLMRNPEINIDQLFEHELSVHPPSLFNANGHLRSADDKAALTNLIVKECKPESTLEDKDNLLIERSVLDMGSLLRTKVMWKKGDTYDKILNDYVRQAQLYPNCIAVFDGYNESSSSTKYLTQLNRSRKVIPAHNIELAPHLTFNCESKESFFANKNNKQSFINMLSDAMEERNIPVVHAKGDADQLIAKTALDLAKEFTTQVVAEDTDIFQLLVSQLNPNSKGLYMVTDKQNAKNPCLDIKAIKSKLDNDCAEYLPVLHAISGCDTTSRPFNIGKTTVWNKKDQIITVAGPFLSPTATPEEIEEAGKKIFCLLYNETDEHFDLDNIRKKKFERTAITSMKSVDIQKLPPTNSAAKYHSYRVYYQVQVWLGNENIQPTDWGWYLIDGYLFPKKMDNEPAPKSLMKVIKCNCTLYCENNQCTCKNNGLFCSEYCV